MSGREFSDRPPQRPERQNEVTASDSTHAPPPSLRGTPRNRNARGQRSIAVCVPTPSQSILLFALVPLADRVSAFISAARVRVCALTNRRSRDVVVRDWLNCNFA